MTRPDRSADSSPGSISVDAQIKSPELRQAALSRPAWSETRTPIVLRRALLHAPRHLARGRQQEGEAAGHALPHDAELPVVESRDMSRRRRGRGTSASVMVARPRARSARMRFDGGASSSRQPSA
jgi:hypothetical protein